MPDLFEYLTNLQQLQSGIKTGASSTEFSANNRNLTPTALPSKQVTPAGPNGPLGNQVTGGENQKVGILNALSTQDAAATLGSLVAALAGDTPAGRLAGAASQGAQGILFNQGLKGGEISSSLSPAQQDVIKQRRRQERLDEVDVLNKQIKTAMELRRLGLSEEESRRRAGLEEERLDLERDRVGLSKERLGLERQRVGALTNYYNSLADKAATGELGVDFDSKQFTDVWAGELKSNYPQLSDIADEVISGSKKPFELIAAARNKLSPEDYNKSRASAMRTYMQVNPSFSGLGNFLFPQTGPTGPDQTGTGLQNEGQKQQTSGLQNEGQRENVREIPVEQLNINPEEIQQTPEGKFFVHRPGQLRAELTPEEVKKLQGTSKSSKLNKRDQTDLRRFLEGRNRDQLDSVRSLVEMIDKTIDEAPAKAHDLVRELLKGLQ